MNIAFFLTLKKDVAYVYDDFTIRQALEKMKHHGYTAIPVISRQGKYVNTVTEGDFLWYMLDESIEDTDGVSIYDAEDLKLRDILPKKVPPAARITATMDELFELALNQNFVPVIDDKDCFIGIVTRKNIIRHFIESLTGAKAPLPIKAESRRLFSLNTNCRLMGTIIHIGGRNSCQKSTSKSRMQFFETHNKNSHIIFYGIFTKIENENVHLSQCYMKMR